MGVRGGQRARQDENTFEQLRVCLAYKQECMKNSATARYKQEF
jgi:hypothetical protein